MSPPDCIAHSYALSGDGQPVLAAGAWFRNTLCLARGREAHVSVCVGDLDTPTPCLAHESVARSVLGWLDAPPAAIAHDLHPDFHSTRHAQALARRLAIPAFAVQHHHAHIAALCAEHGIDTPVLGLALDGVGLGDDGTAWGGELLRVEGAACRRLGHLRMLPLPGGDRAAREPWRMAAAALHALGRGDEIARRFASQPHAARLPTLLARGFNCPRTSSMGRVFDAAAGLLGLCPVMQFDAEAAIALERLASGHAGGRMPPPLDGGWRIAANGELDLLPLLAKLADDGDAGRGAALFHATLVAALGEWTLCAAGREEVDTIALGGGCFFNRLLSTGLRDALRARGLRVLEAGRPGPGDTAIALGQAWVARHRLAH